MLGRYWTGIFLVAQGLTPIADKGEVDKRAIQEWVIAVVWIDAWPIVHKEPFLPVMPKSKFPADGMTLAKPNFRNIVDASACTHDGVWQHQLLNLPGDLAVPLT
jgi:hypothetical protein